MTDLLSKVRWGRVLLASLATHIANVVVALLLIVVYTLLASDSKGSRAEASGILSLARSLLGRCPS